ncbi:MAG: hemerythrin domain-containing protein [Pseudomonadota bacterium]
MKQQAPAYENAIDLLDADHKLVKKLFIDFGALVEDEAPPELKQAVALKICQEITVHAQLEEEIFYPAVREAIGEEGLMDEALEEHDQARQLIAQIQGMSAQDDGYDDTVKALGEAIDHHVLEEREQIFLKAQYANLDLRGMVPALVALKAKLQDASAPATKTRKPAKASAKASARKEHA